MTEPSVRPVEISDAQKQQYIEEGYFILESALDDAQLEYIRGECDRLRDRDGGRDGQGGREIPGHHPQGQPLLHLEPAP